MISIEHNLKFVTEFDETHPVAKHFFTLPEPIQIEFLESMLKEMIAPKIQPVIDEVNKNGSYAILKVAE